MMNMGLISWIVFGALVGWIASLIMRRSSEMGIVANIIIGGIGAALGGWIASLFGLGTVNGFNIYSLLIAVAGAVLLLWIIGMYQRATRSSRQ